MPGARTPDMDTCFFALPLSNLRFIIGNAWRHVFGGLLTRSGRVHAYRHRYQDRWQEWRKQEKRSHLFVINGKYPGCTKTFGVSNLGPDDESERFKVLSFWTGRFWLRCR